MTDEEITALVERIVAEKLAERFKVNAGDLRASMQRVFDNIVLDGRALAAQQAKHDERRKRWTDGLRKLADRGFDKKQLIDLAARGPRTLPEVEALLGTE